jgi:peptidoglycan/LPS O-acetylase OafA/YrhL
MQRIKALDSLRFVCAFLVLVGHLITLFISLLLSYVFYLVVEKPSHLFFVFVSKQLATERY